MRFRNKHPEISKFITFLVVSNIVTLLQIVLMPVIKGIFANSGLADINFQILQIGSNFDESPYYVFNYAAGSLLEGGGGGLAYFLTVQITILIAQVVNFFAQCKITFKAQGCILKVAGWYVTAYIVITITASVLQGVYKAPMYNLFMNRWSLGAMGETIADVITIFINCGVSFWVFYPIFDVIFKNTHSKEDTNA